VLTVDLGYPAEDQVGTQPETLVRVKNRQGTLTGHKPMGCWPNQNQTAVPFYGSHIFGCNEVFGF